MAKKKILITVKTYPSISSKYEELVCTAGFDENGKFIRIYPVPFRKLDYEKQYRKYYWVEMDLVKNISDFRPESFRPANIESEDVLEVLDKIGTEHNWQARKEVVLKKVYKDMTILIEEAKADRMHTSLAVFKPTLIKDFVWEPVEREWSQKQKGALQQQNLFEDKSRFEVVRKLPYKFRYVFEDINGIECKMMNLDWELGALY